MIKMINKHPFIFGVITGIIGVNVTRNKLKKLISGKITIIRIDIRENENTIDSNNSGENTGITSSED